MTCKDCIHYDVCYKKPDHFDDLEVNGGCSDFQDNGEMEITREFILDNGLEFELLSYYEKRRKKALDVEEVRHREWEYPFNRDIAKCTVCGFCVQDKINNVSEMYKYCPNCGADMRGKKK